MASIDNAHDYTPRRIDGDFALPRGWWLLPVIGGGALCWVGIAMAIFG